MITLRTLGGILVEGVDDATGVLARPHAGALLVLLAGGPPAGTPRDVLLALLWPDSDLSRACNSLKQLVFQLRRRAAVPIVVGQGGLVRLDETVIDVDVWRLERAARRQDHQEVARCHAGPFAEGFLPPHDHYELTTWIERRRSALQAHCTAALRALGDAAERAGDVEALIEWRGRQAAIDPLSSRATVAHMRALALAGDRPKALAVARSHTALVRAELETEPDPSVRTLERELRRSAMPVVAPSFTTVVPLADLPGTREVAQADLPAMPNPTRSVILPWDGFA